MISRRVNHDHVKTFGPCVLVFGQMPGFFLDLINHFISFIKTVKIIKNFFNANRLFEHGLAHGGGHGLAGADDVGLTLPVLSTDPLDELAVPVRADVGFPNASPEEIIDSDEVK